MLAERLSPQKLDELGKHYAQSRSEGVPPSAGQILSGKDNTEVDRR